MVLQRPAERPANGRVAPVGDNHIGVTVQAGSSLTVPQSGRTVRAELKRQWWRGASVGGGVLHHSTPDRIKELFSWDELHFIWKMVSGTFASTSRPKTIFPMKWDFGFPGPIPEPQAARQPSLPESGYTTWVGVLAVAARFMASRLAVRSGFRATPPRRCRSPAEPARQPTVPQHARPCRMATPR